MSEIYVPTIKPIRLVKIDVRNDGQSDTQWTVVGYDKIGSAPYWLGDFYSRLDAWNSVAAIDGKWDDGPMYHPYSKDNRFHILRSEVLVAEACVRHILKWGNPITDLSLALLP